MVIPIIGSIPGIFLVVILVRAWMFRPAAENITEAAPVTLNQDKIIKDMQDVIRNNKIQIRVLTGDNPSDCSDTTGEAWQCLKGAIQAAWRSAIVSPYLMMACSDARHYAKVSDKVYRFSPMKLFAEERAMIHGNNERIPIETLIKTVEFYIRLLKEC